MTAHSLSTRRAELEEQVAQILASYSEGALQRTHESQAIDFKEEAGRRGPGGLIEPGSPENPEAATKLADEVACFANSPGGGALIVGVEDRTGRVIGTELGVDWLRQRINAAVSVAPDIVDTEVGGLRVLVIYVAESRDPVLNTGGRLRWRVGDSCREVDRSEWWLHRDARTEHDPFARPSQRDISDVRRDALQKIRDLLPSHEFSTDEQILRSIGALRSDNKLSEAAALLLTEPGRTFLELTILDVPGGSVLNVTRPHGSLSLLEQIFFLEEALRLRNSQVTLARGLSHSSVRRVPEGAVREAILNGVIHRDWGRLTEPTELRWVDADSAFTVRSPGGFPRGVNASNILSNRDARYPALADLFRALTLVEKQGLGVDRMYQSMIVLGHRPPSITEAGGPFVECTLTGGDPVAPVMDMVRAITPAERQKDVNIALILYRLLHRPFLSLAGLSELMQSTEEAARVALRAAQQTSIDGTRLIRAYKNAWILGEGGRARLASLTEEDSAFPLMAFGSTDSTHLASVALEWAAFDGAVTTGDLMELSGVSRGTARRALEDLAERGKLELTGAGRSTRYEARKVG